ncbi:RNA 2',3'-cyclic phosphodiesterase [Sphingomonas sp. PL-96]|uniref:RNA 2',3'-cyclic phosphodiesterase n=1 Tax=Sphingomonas sp. PL-96 TaxID=2887201 RepID=UPI001E31925E|nr:RNA 2',3'-cyclic phosphodiesterase [Sphingomonas sp. PL-96]MCC2975209.1 RNA 2',3'-cyclic phosphodiesterase [Sphingomonas sp. PL-96]
MHRLFVALRPPLDIRQQLLALMEGVENARWQEDEQLHLTLRFIGAVERPVAEDIATALGSIHGPAVTLRLHGVGCFDRKGRTTALWAGVHPHEGVAALHRKVDQALARLGLPHEGRAFHPHITLARMNSAGGPTDAFVACNAGLASAPFTLSHMLLFESTLTRDGASYEAVARYPLG